MTISDIRNILEAPYNRKVWKSFIQTQFTNNNLLANDAPLNLGKSDLYTECYSLGNYAIDDYTKIGIFEVILTKDVNLTRNRVVLRNLIKSITQQVAGAMVVFVQPDKGLWRFSYISKRKIRNAATNTVEDKETAPKRYTYLFGKGEKALTASIRFDRLIQKQQGNLYQFLTLNDFEEAFSVEKLSKDFFNEYKKIYDDFVEFITGKRYVKKGSKFIETQVHEAHFQLRNYFSNDEKQARDFFKRMMGRIVFLYFIQKKGWLAVPKNKQWGEGNPDYLFELYKNAKYKDSFYSDYLVPLFFDTLNNPNVQEGTALSPLGRDGEGLRFPYLNGGLFDKTQDFKFDKIALPAEIFEKLFNTFNNYNFTIYEDAPDEHTVAVDPEMLGHIFENLLEDNKDKGAFYTPKDIVHYMCRESLHNYIYTYTGNEDNQDFKTKLKQYNDTFDISIFEKDEIKLIDRALEDVKICDPAIGSGAFPMGLLHEIYHLKIPIEDSKGMKAKSPADLKKHIIEESIYGVDIDNGAVDIARLRFWLSLVVDEVKPQPLPNLAFKIVCANTLIPLGNYQGMNIAGATEVVNEIAKVREKYFDASKEDKKDLERSFINLQNKLLTTAREWSTKEQSAVYEKIYEFNPFEDKSCSWFDPWWMFGVKDGFDIVIGNPPYVVPSLSKLEKENYKKNYKSALYQINLYLLFVEKGSFLLKENGILSYIIPNTWLVNKAVADFRKLLINELDILSIVDLTFEKVFEATVLPIILFITKGKNRTDIIPIISRENDEFFIANEIAKSEIRLDENYLINYQISKDKRELVNLIENETKPLHDFAKVSFGIKLYEVGQGKPVQTKETVSNKPYSHKSKINQYCRRLLEGKNIDKYRTNFKDDWLEYGEWIAAPRKKEMFEGERIVIRRIIGENGLIGQFLNEDYVNNSLLHVVKLTNEDLNTKFILSILNSRLIGFYFISKFARKEKTFPEIRIHELENLPIKLNSNQIPFTILVDYLLFLHNKENEALLTHTDNSRIASHIEDILNMMVYELYFTDHMKEVGIDVLQFINPKPIDNVKDNTAKGEIIKDFYQWYQTPENPVRQRLLLVDTRSKDKIALINKSM